MINLQFSFIDVFLIKFDYRYFVQKNKKKMCLISTTTIIEIFNDNVYESHNYIFFVNVQRRFIRKKNQRNDDDIFRQFFLLFSSSIIRVHFVIIACFFFVFDRRFYIISFERIFIIVCKKFVIEKKTNYCNDVSIIDDFRDDDTLIFYFDLNDKKYFFEIIV